MIGGRVNESMTMSLIKSIKYSTDKITLASDLV
ncbi:hypothetical protein Godav_001233 [Gossypium davidsonii]|uniref:Uncharacterized protein n=2 Tax=Gossypium TaxID=3633 RepID=A0A7J8T387_GOSDV|nr:hypothetical protein [Gossypium davidsonii]MBA0672745.1 hypothetical protein [Gossypium klotzschianum]